MYDLDKELRKDKNSGRNSVLQKRAKNNKFKVPL